MLYSETNLVKSFGRSIVSKSVDPALNIEETSVDALFEDSLLVEKIPVIKDIFAPGKTVSVSDKFFCKRLVAFIQEFNNGNISQYRMDKHIDKLKEDKRLDSEYEQVIILIEKLSQTLQAKYLARFYQSYWNGDYDFDTFREIAEANQKMFTCDYEVLQSIAGDASATGKDSSMSRLVSLGLIVDRRSAGEGVSLTGFGIEFAKGLDAKKKPARKSSSGAKKPSINEDLFSGRLQSSEKTEAPQETASAASKPDFNNMDIDEAFAFLAAAPSPFKPVDKEEPQPESYKAKPVIEAPEAKNIPAAPLSIFESGAKAEPEAPKAMPEVSKAKAEPEAPNAKAEPEAPKAAPEAPKTRPGTSKSKSESSASKPKSTPKPAFDPKDTSTIGVKQLRPIINTEKDSPYASSPMASDGSSPFKPAKSKKIEADTPKTKTSKSKSASVTAEIPDDNNPFRAAANSESKTPKSAENSPFKPIGAPAAQETSSPFKPAASAKPEPAAKTAEPSPFKPAVSAKAETAKTVESSPFKPAVSKPEPAAPKAVDNNPFKPFGSTEMPKAAEPSPFKPAPAKKAEPEPAKEPASSNPFRPIGSTEMPKAVEPSPFKPLGAAKTEAPQAEPSPFKPLGAAKTEAPAAEPGPFKPLGAAKTEAPAEPSPFMPLGAAKTEAPQAEPSPFKPITAKTEPEAPKAEPANNSPFKPLGATNTESAPASEPASSSPFKPFGNINQDPPVHIEGANPNMFNMGSLSHPNSDSSKGTSKLGSFMSMDDDEVLHQDKETGKLGSYMSMDEGEDTGERLPQRTESSTNYFAMSSASSAPSHLSSSDANPFKPMKPANSGSSSRGANPSPFKPATPAKSDSDDSPAAPANPSPFKPLGS